MKRTVKALLLWGGLGILSGCSTGYWVDRGRDAADIITLTVGVGAGGGIRVGPFAQGIGLNGSYFGMHGGNFGRGHRDKWHSMESTIIFMWSSYGNQTFLSERRGKDYVSLHCLGIAMPMAIELEPRYPLHYFTQVEAFVGMGGTVKVGFNFGELADFLLGFIGVDLFDDDIGVVQESPPYEPRRPTRDLQ